jgi:hypothetical protein
MHVVIQEYSATPDRASDKDAGAPEIEITPAMLKAGTLIVKYNFTTFWESVEPHRLDAFLTDVYRMMSASAPKYARRV